MGPNFLSIRCLLLLPAVLVAEVTDLDFQQTVPFLPVSAASAEKPASPPKAAARESTPPTQPGMGEKMEQRLLKYAEQRAENAEQELKRFRETHETSVRACSDATQRKQKEIEACQKQSENLRTMYNSLQGTKAELEKKLRELEAKQAVAATSNEVETYRNAAEKAQKKVLELEKSQSQDRSQIDQLRKEKARHEAEVTSLRERVRHLEQRSAEAAEREKSQSASSPGASANQNIFSLSLMTSTLQSIGQLYMALGDYTVSRVPAEFWQQLAMMRLEAETLAAPYLQTVREKVWEPVAPSVTRGREFFWDTVYPLGAAAVSKGMRFGWSLSDDFVPSVNGRIDAALEPVYKLHPEVEPLVPAGLADRIALIVFLVLVTHFIALLAFRWVLCPALAFVCPCCCKRRHSKKKSKKYMPAQESGMGGMLNVPGGGAGTVTSASRGKDTSSKKAAQQQATPTRPFALSGGEYNKRTKA
ncbi:transmembrane protein [Cystoisospora suis]|uniref:Transmembrane protein n=1 Tax=Cystoisospora suis TaxID=483139 RepID=A0A2C6L802_9APIC|nr:transmembrane protein [Cystoisospora suis]